MPDDLHTRLQPYITRFQKNFAEQEKNNSIRGKSGLEVRDYLKAKIQDCFSEEKIDHLTRDDFIDIYTHSPTLLRYASRGPDLHERVESLIDEIGSDAFRGKIKYLLYGNGNLAERYAEVINSTRSLNHEYTSEILSYYSPYEYACLNGTAERALTFLGLDTTTAPKIGEGRGEYYLQFTAIAKEILDEIRKDPDPVLHNADYPTLDSFLNQVGWINAWQVAPGEGGHFWVDDPVWKEKKIASIGYQEVVDRSGEKIVGLRDYQDILDEMKETHPDWSIKRVQTHARFVHNFINSVDYGDIICANKGKEKILAIGRVVSEAKVDPSLEYPIYRDVDWFYPDIDVAVPEKMKGKCGKTITQLKHGEVLPILRAAHTQDSPRDPGNHQYWSLLPSSRMQETYAPLKHWDEWQEKGIIGIPWEMLAEKYGDTLFEFSDPDVFREKFRKAVEGDPFEKPASAYMPYDFLFTMEEEDTVVIPRGRQAVIGQARIVSGPKIDLTLDFPVYREVTWEVFENEIPIPIELQSTIVGKRLKKITQEDYEALFHQDADIMEDPEFRKITRLLTAKNQVILYGPPGTGKTYTAQKYIAARPGATSAFVTFHPSFAYEDFIEGLRPRTDAEGRICYEIEDGIFKTLCRDAFNALMERAGIESRWEEGEGVPALSPREEAEALAVRDRVPVFLVVDEINRGDIPRIFGELITLLEKDKRLCTGNALVTTLPYSKTHFGIPPNLFVIGTMNTADRSIALLDIALRRRFGFIEVMPDYEVLEETLASGDPAVQEVFDLAAAALREVNARITEHYDRDHQIGHSYLMKLRGCTTRDEAVEALQTTWECEVLPLLQEYFYDSPQTFRECVGSDGVMPDDGEEFIRALSANLT
ncbi:MAG: AAA family ATPase [Methanofollis sp.]|uniref:AAA family ATPase n=1 Tax=Methanofollis sp. TaxID=2052835 RepID=UPI00260CDF90|nr:AAA family ATPase [Methanofollis sp.]MDD4255856.1 AAA family ATPase [Methanofollis sp.]